MTRRTFKAVIKHGNGNRFSRKLAAWDVDNAEEGVWSRIFDRLRVPTRSGLLNTTLSGYAGKSFARAAEAICAATPPQVAAASRWAFEFMWHPGYWEYPRDSDEEFRPGIIILYMTSLVTNGWRRQDYAEQL